MSDWDDDIAQMQLSDAEKNGLQMYRNYESAFRQKRRENFVNELKISDDDLDSTRRVVKLIATEDPRFLPVIACSFVDDELSQMFRREIPTDIPGGAKEMLSAFGPLHSLSNKIRFAFAFDMTSRDLLIEVDRLRRLRNDLAHTWEIAAAAEFYSGNSVAQLIDNSLAIQEANSRLSKDRNFSPDVALRVGLAFLLARVAYECRAYPSAKRALLHPLDALYSRPFPSLLDKLSALAAGCRDQIAGPRSRDS